MALCPFAEQRLIPPGANDPRIQPRLAILHIAVTAAWSLYEYFRDRSGGIESHFYVTWRGKIEQYRDTDYEADANYGANPFAISIESQGFGGGRWNLLQRRAIKRLLRWISETHPVPLRAAEHWQDAGVGYHSQYPEWSPVAKSCPGPLRIRQYREWLVPWMATPPSPVALFRAVVEPALAAAREATPVERTAAHQAYDAIEAALARCPKA